MNGKKAFMASLYKERIERFQAMGMSVESEKRANIQDVLLQLKSLFPSDKFESGLPPIILHHQVYALLSDRTYVDKQLLEMRKTSKIRSFRFGTGQDDVAFVFMNDYLAYVETCCGKNPTVAMFVNKVVKKTPDLCFSKDDLYRQYAIKEDVIRELIQQGVLVSRDVGCYWLSLPQVGEFLKALRCGRKAMLDCITKTNFKEILRKEFEEIKLPSKAVLGNEYFMHDLIGLDLLKNITVENETYLRLQSMPN